MSPSCRWNTRERLSDPRQKRELNEQIFSVVAPLAGDNYTYPLTTTTLTH